MRPSLLFKHSNTTYGISTVRIQIHVKLGAAICFSITCIKQFLIFFFFSLFFAQQKTQKQFLHN